jgi:hypothetical protein
MKRMIGIVLLVGGIILLVYGLRAKDSFESQVSQTFRGSPSRNSVVLLGGGALCCAVGLGIVMLKGKG